MAINFMYFNISGYYSFLRRAAELRLSCWLVHLSCNDSLGTAHRCRNM